jgi:hypothetical protein
MSVRKLRNLVGPQVRRFRCAKNWSQEQLMFKLLDFGWNICRQRIARIEACEAWVSDFEMVLIAKALDVRVEDLLPKFSPAEPIYTALSKLLDGQVKTLMPPDDILAIRSTQLLIPNCQCEGETLSRTADKNGSAKTLTSSEDEFRTDRIAASAKQTA